MTPKPIIFLAFANDREDGIKHLRNLNKELHGIEEALKPIKDQFEVIHYEGITLKVLFDRFQEYKDRIVIFHYGGHADGYQLLLETTEGGNQTTYGKGLINFLATFKDSLKLVFFNGCTTENLAEDLANAGLSAVIGTESTINDEVATRLAIRFYNGLANDHSIENAWKQAVGEIEAIYNTEAGTRGLYRKEAKEAEMKELPWKIYCTDENLLDWKLKNQNNMLAEQLLSGLLSTYESGGAEFLKSVGEELAKGLATDTLKKLGGKVMDFFKGKKEEDTIDALENAVSKKDAEKFKAKSESVLQLLKSAVETDEKFAQEVKEIIAGLDEKGQKELAETSGRIVKNIANFTGNNNVVIQGTTNSQIHIGNNIKKQFNIKGDYYENKD